MGEQLMGEAAFAPGAPSGAGLANTRYDQEHAMPSFTRVRPACLPRVVALATAGAVALLGPPAAPALERHQELKREFTLPAGERRVEIDNVFGSVRVRAGGGDKVTITIRQSVSSRREAELASAFEEVTLEEHQSGGRLELVQDGPFRCERRSSHRSWSSCDWDADYDVRWDWEVVLPADVALDVATVNEGDVRVEGVRGRVRARNVNGEVHASGLVAETAISTVNGDVSAEFAKLPAAGGSFETVNGEIELTLPASAQAEVAFETMNGEIYSDFDVEAVPQRTVAGNDERGRVRGTRKSYKLDRDAVVRIGAGGPRFDCETLNGDIVVRSK
jgi:hypothetical protein